MIISVQKPPATLKIKLSCKIELHSIKIWTCIGSLKSLKLEIYVKSSWNNYTSKIGESTVINEVGVDFSILHDQVDHFYLKKADFYRSAHYMIKNVDEIQVCIKETSKCPPVIKKLEIWGKCSRSNSQEDIKRLENLWHQEIDPPIHCEDELILPLSEPKSINSGTIIDDDFLDCITYEIMSLPMVLPSGKIIDQSTVLKHNEYEEKLGRSPSDPFTFQIYTSTRKPILNAALKARIDKFLLQNSNNIELRGVGRTVGRKESAQSEVQFYNNASINYEAKNCSKRIKLDPGPSAGSSSLDSMINNALKSITRFSQPKEIKEVKCYKCDSSNLLSLYKIKKCTHLICRECLLLKNLLCTVCCLSFSNKDVEKFHVN